MKRTVHLLLLTLSFLAASCSAGQEPFLPSSVEELAGHTVAVPEGSTTDLFLSQYKDIDLMRIGLGEMAVAVKNGRAEFAMVQETQFDATRMQDKGFRKCFSGLLKGVAALGFRKEDTLLCARFNAFLQEFIDSGEHERWYTGWTTNPDSMAVAVRQNTAPPEGEALVVGITLAFPFIYLKDEELSGLEVDMMDRFCRQAGFKPEYCIIDFPAMIPALHTHKTDILLSHMQVTPERAKQILFSDPYFEGSICCYGRDPDAGSLSKRSLSQTVINSVRTNLIEENYWKILLGGLLVTLEISCFSILLSVLLGAIFCFFRMRRSSLVSGFTKVLAETVQGIPVLVVLMIMCYVVFARSDISGVLVAIFSFGLFYGAVFCELFRAGMLSVDRGQWEAGAALGLGKFQVFRLIAFPQALRQIVPVFKGDVVSLIKSTAIVGYVAVMDLTNASNVIRARTFDSFFPLILISIIYIILSRLIGSALNALERRVNMTKQQ